jgi:hypothetical protein
VDIEYIQGFSVNVRSGKLYEISMRNRKVEIQILEVNNISKLSKVHLLMMLYPIILPAEHLNIMKTVPLKYVKKSLLVGHIIINNNLDTTYTCFKSVQREAVYFLSLINHTWIVFSHI